MFLIGCGRTAVIDNDLEVTQFETMPINTMTISCHCPTSQEYIGKFYSNYKCPSKYETTEMCEECCEYWYDRCVKPMLKRYCK